MSERNGALYCNECNLAIMRQPHRAVPREASAYQPASVKHYHNREAGDCWSKHLVKAKELAAAAGAKITGYAHDAGMFPKGVIH